jgi:hypothetical protein
LAIDKPTYVIDKGDYDSLVTTLKDSPDATKTFNALVAKVLTDQHGFLRIGDEAETSTAQVVADKIISGEPLTTEETRYKTDNASTVDDAISQEQQKVVDDFRKAVEESPERFANDFQLNLFQLGQQLITSAAASATNTRTVASTSQPIPRLSLSSDTSRDSLADTLIRESLQPAISVTRTEPITSDVLTVREGTGLSDILNVPVEVAPRTSTVEVRTETAPVETFRTSESRTALPPRTEVRTVTPTRATVTDRATRNVPERAAEQASEVRTSTEGRVASPEERTQAPEEEQVAPPEERAQTLEEERAQVPEERIPPPEERTPPPPEERRPPSPEERRPPPPPTEKTFPLPPVSNEEAKKMVAIPQGSIAWRQGELFGKEEIKYIPPPYNQPKPITLLGKKPAGWLEKGRTPQETLQIIGEPGVSIPQTVSFNLGVVDGLINTQKMSIDFTGGGLATDVGKLGNPTTGMSIPAVTPQRLAVEQRRMTIETLPSKPKVKRQLADMDAQQSLSEIL